MQYRHLVDFNDITASQWNALYRLGRDIMHDPQKYADSCKGKVLATLFYEPSTRTMLSFQTAMLRLGGSVIGFDSPANSSVSKGENLKDTITIISSYADIIAMRNPQEGAALAASLYSTCPVINAGDGGHFHPTQTLTDLTTITMEKGKLDGLTIGLCGDLKHGRTVHSLLRALSVLGKNTYYLVSTLTLKMPQYIIDTLRESGNMVYELTSLDDCIEELDILYMTRIQKERFQSEDMYKKESGKYILTPEKLLHAKPDLSILHPLPRVDEISSEVDFDKRAMYFKQAENGMYIRMALILTMLKNGKFMPDIYECKDVKNTMRCPNPVCVTNTEKYLPPLTYTLGGTRPGHACKYCDFRID
ncbi:MAG: aspartate carbamoyltransferase [Clostridiales bacterium]|nr:MAG: aspartate carbamoyltransferase [Clostridiales bacterium]